MQILLSALNQEYAKSPYVFNTTGFSVYSFEEALFHCCHNWRESLDDYMSGAFADWVETGLGLPHIAAKIRETEQIEGFCARYTAFLRIVPYFDGAQLQKLSYELEAWETVFEWEQLKKRADALTEKGNAKNALPLYIRALEYGEDAAVLNNAGICLLKQGRADEALAYLARAHEIAPGNTDILLSFTEAAIHSHSFNRAVTLLNKLNSIDRDTDIKARIDYLRGELSFETGDIQNAAMYYKRSADATGECFYKIRLSETYVKLRMYDEALAALDGAEDNAECLKAKAEVHKARGHIPAAVRCIEKALLINKSDAGLWTVLAAYYRMNYQHQKAQAAIQTALNLEPGGEQTLLEHARIYRAAGDTQKYREILRDILYARKREYRSGGG